MSNSHRFWQLKHLHTPQGLNASQIARELALDPRTVAYWLAHEPFRPRKPRPRPSQLDPFKKEIVRLLEHSPYSAAQVFQRLRARGFAGFHGLVDLFVAAGVLRSPGDPVVVTRLAELVWLIAEFWLASVEVSGETVDDVQMERGIALMLQVLDPFIVSQPS